MSIVTDNGMTVLDDLDSAPNGPQIVQQLGNEVDKFYGGKVASASALPGAGSFAGQRVWLVDVKGWAVWNGAAWITDTTWQTTGFTLGSGWALGTVGLIVRRAHGDTYLQVEVNKSSFVANETAFTIPDGFRLRPQPSGVTAGWRESSNNTASNTLVEILTSGVCRPLQSGTGGLIFTSIYPHA